MNGPGDLPPSDPLRGVTSAEARASADAAAEWNAGVMAVAEARRAKAAAPRKRRGAKR